MCGEWGLNTNCFESLPILSHLFFSFFFYKQKKVAKKQGHMPSADVLAARAASLAACAIPETIATPSTAYQFEVSWRLLCSDSAKQANLLKVSMNFKILFSLISLFSFSSCRAFRPIRCLNCSRTRSLLQCSLRSSRAPPHSSRTSFLSGLLSLLWHLYVSKSS